MEVRSIRYWSMKVIGSLVVFLWLFQNVFAQSQTTDIPALIPMPQKVAWNKQHFKIEGNKSRMVQRIVPNFPEVPTNQDEAYILKVNADSVILQAK
ncbi:MAG: hypothetical protein Q7U65_03820, partial [Bacteroidota bacterium]|nr:hypothetical protein [Bacteroidota bacterium]